MNKLGLESQGWKTGVLKDSAILNDNIRLHCSVYIIDTLENVYEVSEFQRDSRYVITDDNTLIKLSDVKGVRFY